MGHEMTSAPFLLALLGTLGLVAGCSTEPSDGTYYCNPLVSQAPSDWESSKAEIWRTKYGEQVYWQAKVGQAEVVELSLYFNDIGPTRPYETGATEWRDRSTFVVSVGLPPGWGRASGLPASGSVAVLCLLDE